MFASRVIAHCSMDNEGGYACQKIDIISTVTAISNADERVHAACATHDVALTLQFLVRTRGYSRMLGELGSALQLPWMAFDKPLTAISSADVTVFVQGC